MVVDFAFDRPLLVVKMMEFDDAIRLLENEVGRLRARMEVTEDRERREALPIRVEGLRKAIRVLRLVRGGRIDLIKGLGFKKGG